MLRTGRILICGQQRLCLKMVQEPIVADSMGVVELQSGNYILSQRSMIPKAELAELEQSLQRDPYLSARMESSKPSHICRRCTITDVFIC